MGDIGDVWNAVKDVATLFSSGQSQAMGARAFACPAGGRFVLGSTPVVTPALQCVCGSSVPSMASSGKSPPQPSCSTSRSDVVHLGDRSGFTVTRYV